MNFTCGTGDVTKQRADVLLVPVFDSDLNPKKQPDSALARLDRRMRGQLLKSALQEGFKGKHDQTASVPTMGRLPSARVILVGLGSKARFTPEVLRLAAGRGLKASAKLKARSMVVAIPATPKLEPCLKATVEGCVLGSYRYDRWRTTNKEERSSPPVSRIVLALPKGQAKEPHLDTLISLAARIGEAVNWARDLVNEPAGTMTPSILAEEAKGLAKEGVLKVEILDRKRIESLSMGLFLGVARGSIEEPRLIKVSWLPKDEAALKRPPVCLVGKAITFDSGGLSLKPSDAMMDMKTDMAGSAAVLGAMRVIATLAPPFPVHAFMGACENMPSGNAYRLGDILVSRLGKTVEITNTDAEGRLVLGDVLTLANELKPAAMIDLATLTGACMVALGNHIAGAFGDDEPLMGSLLDAARASGEEIWRLPVSELQKESLKSDVADLKNSGDRWGGAISAALFLKEFVGETPWVHLDIAGPSQAPKERGYFLKGATGFGVRTLVEFIRTRAQEIEASDAA